MRTAALKHVRGLTCTVTSPTAITKEVQPFKHKRVFGRAFSLHAFKNKYPNRSSSVQRLQTEAREPDCLIRDQALLPHSCVIPGNFSRLQCHQVQNRQKSSFPRSGEAGNSAYQSHQSRVLTFPFSCSHLPKNPETESASRVPCPA